MSGLKDTSLAARSCLYLGQVMHRRLRPFGHRFSYRVYSLFMELDEIGRLGQSNRFFSYNRFNLLSFHDKDHGARDGGCLRSWAKKQLVTAGVHDVDGQIFLLCFPRVLGYVFSPLSVWYCYRRGGDLGAIIYEVRNTFGEKRAYVLPAPDGGQPDTPVLQSCRKDFYVSPFIEMDSLYRFRLSEPGERLSILIRQWVAGEELLIATQTARRMAFTDSNLLAAFFRVPLVAQKVTAAIHWQAFKIWLKGGRLQPRPGIGPEHGTTTATQKDRNKKLRWKWKVRA